MSEMIKHTLYDWQPDCDGTTSLEVAIEPDGIRIEEPGFDIGEGRRVWVELQGGVLRVHCYDHRHEEPFNVDIGPEEITAWDNRE